MFYYLWLGGATFPNMYTSFKTTQKTHKHARKHKFIIKINLKFQKLEFTGNG